MVGFATDESDEMLPLCYLYARNICLKLQELRLSPTNRLFENLRSDAKSQVTLTPEGRITEVIVAVQHNDGIELQDIRQAVIENVLKEVLPNIPHDEKLIINGTGSFVMGGTIGDAGVVGRKIVVDAYGPQVSVGGGAYSGKDPTKVDRSAAYMARHIAKRIIAEKVKGASECVVKIAYGIGQKQPAMVSAVTDKGDVTDFVRENFSDLSPGFIINQFNLRRPSGNPALRVGNKEGWNYIDTASYGHYGRESFPWEKLD
jgi:S-adenosylmethionine synthetase